MITLQTTRRIDVGCIFSFCLKLLEPQRKVYLRGAPGRTYSYSWRTCFLISNSPILQQLFPVYRGRFQNVINTALGDFTHIWQKGTRRISCRIKASIFDHNKNFQLKKLLGRDNEMVQALQ